VAASNYFEHVFMTFVDSIYGSSAKTIGSDERQLLYNQVFDALLDVLANQGVAYEDFIKSELLDWSRVGGSGNPLSLPFREEFLRSYTQKKYKYSFLVLCLQTRPPGASSAGALMQACRAVLAGPPSQYGSITNFLEAGSEYSDPTAVALVADILPLLTEEWYSQELLFYIQCLLDANPGPLSTALGEQLIQLESEIELRLRAS
jgi:hypothetical protein